MYSCMALNKHASTLFYRPLSVTELIEKGTQHVVTFCRSIDDVMGGGIPVGKITEIFGVPGTGKTQFW